MRPGVQLSRGPGIVMGAGPRYARRSGPPTVGLLARWSFDAETISGDTVLDVAGTSHGTKGAGVTPGDVGLDFDGAAGSVIACGNPAALNVGVGDFSLVAWVSSLAAGRIFCKGNVDGGNEFPGYSLRVGADMQLYLRINDGTNGGQLGNNTPLTAGFHHVVVTCDRDGNAIFYLDSNPDGSGSIANRQQSLDDSSEFVIGGYSGNHGYAVFRGSMDDVMVYGRVLTPAEVASIYVLGTA